MLFRSNGRPSSDWKPRRRRLSDSAILTLRFPKRRRFDHTVATRRHVLLLGLALGVACVARSQTPSLRIGIETDAAPISFLQPDGKIGGFSVDLINALAGEMQCETRLVTGSWPDVFERFKAGEIDLLASVAYTKERDAYTWTSPPRTSRWAAPRSCVAKPHPSAGSTTSPTVESPSN